MHIYFILLFQIWSLRPLSCWSLHHLDISTSFLKQFLTFWHHSILQAHLMFSLMQLWKQKSTSGGPDSLYWRMAVRNQDLDTRCAHCYCGVIAPNSSQRTELADIWMDINSFTHMHLYLFMYLMYKSIKKPWVHTPIFHSNPTPHFYFYHLFFSYFNIIFQ